MISRVHPSLVGGPPLVHVDAYRLGGLEELDDLDLDTSLEDAVTVVEWGERAGRGARRGPARGPAAALARRHRRGRGEARTLRLTPVGPRWADVDLADRLAAPGA